MRVRESLVAVGLPVEESAGLDPFSLRKGERQRVAVASILATRPAVLIFDEPTTGLDAEETDRMMAMVRELNLQGHTDCDDHAFYAISGLSMRSDVS